MNWTPFALIVIATGIVASLADCHRLAKHNCGRPQNGVGAPGGGVSA